MTSVWVAEHGWCYLNAAIDCCTREIVGWALDVRCPAAEAIAVIDQAVADRGRRARRADAWLRQRHRVHQPRVPGPAGPARGHAPTRRRGLTVNPNGVHASGASPERPRLRAAFALEISAYSRPQNGLAEESSGSTAPTNLTSSGKRSPTPACGRTTKPPEFSNAALHSEPSRPYQVRRCTRPPGLADHRARGAPR